jgi:DnaD/phage-associated family protein
VSFAGFPSRAKATAIPNVFFTDVLPQLAGDPASVAVALYAFKALAARKGFPRYLVESDLTADVGFTSYVANAGVGDGSMSEALRRVCDARVLLSLDIVRDGRRMRLYFLNDPADRRGLEAVRSGRVDIGRVVEPPAASSERSSIFALYESLIGTISPLVADELAEAERLYPADWLEAAFREAAAQNARSWRYVSRILERWAVEGPDHAKAGRDPAAGERYFTGKYGRILKQRQQR